MAEEELSALGQLAQELGESQQGGSDLTPQIYNQLNNADPNLIVWQLELDNILERIEHLLKGDILKDDGEGNIVYTTPENRDLVVLNEYGVQLIMNIISMYLNRNTILSNYTDVRIFEILYDVGNELADLIYINYEKMGLDTVEKKARSNVLVMSMLHMIESSYNRALGGDEKNSLRTARVVTQTQPLGNPNIHSSQPARRFSLNPFGKR